jgi:hypothetical protein
MSAAAKSTRNTGYVKAAAGTTMGLGGAAIVVGAPIMGAMGGGGSAGAAAGAAVSTYLGAPMAIMGGSLAADGVNDVAKAKSMAAKATALETLIRGQTQMGSRYGMQPKGGEGSSRSEAMSKAWQTRREKYGQSGSNTRHPKEK